jgi:RimJ/RimL family protein N-acetyltransferase
MTPPTVETPRLRLRGWHAADVDSYAALLADPATARFITRKGRPCSAAEGWAEIAFFIGHWQLRGFGMFVIEARDGGTFLGRAGLLQPEGWPGLELAWALTAEARGQGYATEGAAAAAAWAFDRIGADDLVSIIHPDNGASQRVATRLGARRTDETFAPFGERCEIWRLDRESGQRAAV